MNAVQAPQSRDELEALDSLADLRTPELPQTAQRLEPLECVRIPEPLRVAGEAADVHGDAAAELPSALLRGFANGLLIETARGPRNERIDEDLRLFMGNRDDRFRLLAESVVIGGRQMRVFGWTEPTATAE